MRICCFVSTIWCRWRRGCCSSSMNFMTISLPWPKKNTNNKRLIAMKIGWKYSRVLRSMCDFVMIYANCSHSDLKLLFDFSVRDTMKGHWWCVSEIKTIADFIKTTIALTKHELWDDEIFRVFFGIQIKRITWCGNLRRLPRRASNRTRI